MRYKIKSTTTRNGLNINFPAKNILSVSKFVQQILFTYFCKLFLKDGPVAEWLGRALQKLPQQFKSARDLKKAVEKVEDSLGECSLVGTNGQTGRNQRRYLGEIWTGLDSVNVLLTFCSLSLPKCAL